MPVIAPVIILVVFITIVNSVLWFIVQKEGLIFLALSFGIIFYIDIHTLIEAIYDYLADRSRTNP